MSSTASDLLLDSDRRLEMPGSSPFDLASSLGYLLDL